MGKWPKQWPEKVSYSISKEKSELYLKHLCRSVLSFVIDFLTLHAWRDLTPSFRLTGSDRRAQQHRTTSDPPVRSGPTRGGACTCLAVLNCELTALAGVPTLVRSPRSSLWNVSWLLEELFLDFFFCNSVNNERCCFAWVCFEFVACAGVHVFAYTNAGTQWMPVTSCCRWRDSKHHSSMFSWKCTDKTLYCVQY